jgi:hypothetical protein
MLFKYRIPSTIGFGQFECRIVYYINVVYVYMLHAPNNGVNSVKRLMILGLMI